LVPSDFGRSSRRLPLRRGSVSLEVEYDHPVPAWDRGLVSTMTDNIDLYLWSQPWPFDEFVERTFDGPDGVSITSSYFRVTDWALGPVVGCQKVSARSVQTTIESYSSEPIVLRGYFSRAGMSGFSSRGWSRASRRTSWLSCELRTFD